MFQVYQESIIESYKNTQKSLAEAKIRIEQLEVKGQTYQNFKNLSQALMKKYQLIAS